MNLYDYLNEIRMRKDADDRCLFRGQANSKWVLDSGAKRRLKSTTSIRNKQVYSNVYLYYHRQLVESARRMTSLNDRERSVSDMQILADLQHLGAGTGLLDFTWSSQVALWFAVSDLKYHDCDGCVYFISDTAQNTAMLSPTYENLPSDEILSRSIDEDISGARDESVIRTKRNELSRFKHLIWEPTITGDAGIRIFGQRSVFLDR